MTGVIAVFAGPTISRNEISLLLPKCWMRPPIQRGDLYRLLESPVPQRPHLIVVIDGLFGSNFAATAGEFADACSGGLRIVGTASLGAVRAVECASFGMLGYGRIARAYANGTLSSDAEVAVAVHPSDDYRAISIAMIDVRIACDSLVSRGILDDLRAKIILRVSSEIHYLERTPALLRHRLIGKGVLSLSDFDLFVAAADAKLSDARDCLNAVRRGELSWPKSSISVARDRLTIRGFPTQIAGTLVRQADRHSFLEWLIGSGRIWSYLSRADVRGWTDNPSKAGWILTELDNCGALDSELLIWQSHLTCAAEGSRSGDPYLSSSAKERTEAEALIFARHGVATFADLVKMLYEQGVGVVSLSQVQRSVELRTAALVGARR